MLLPVRAAATSRRTQRWAVRSAALVLALLAIGLSLPDGKDRSPAPTSPGTSRSSQPGSTGDERSSGIDGEGARQGGRGSRGEVL